MTLKYFMVLLTMIPFINNSNGADHLATQVQKNVDFSTCESIMFDPPIKVTTGQTQKFVSFANVYPCHDSDNVYIIANIRTINKFSDVHMHEREDFFEAQKRTEHPGNYSDMSAMKFQNGEGVYTSNMLLFLGHWNVFLSENPFPRAGLPTADQERLVLERLLQIGISTRQ